ASFHSDGTSPVASERGRSQNRLAPKPVRTQSSSPEVTMEPFCGTWSFVESQNFDEYMMAIGVNIAMRKVGNLTKPTVVISTEGEHVTIQTKSTFKDTEVAFILGEEFDELTLDDRHAKTNFMLDGGKLIQVQKWDGKETKIVREIVDDQMVFGDIEDVRSTAGMYSRTGENEGRLC
uniref:Fatty acid binding protein 7, brain, a n=1 Tax=Eptatretus burgeri TaxID=7764 RepID=A0A8C4QN00_EPTBU